MKLIKCCAVTVLSLLMYFNSFAQNKEEARSQMAVVPEYIRTAPGCISTLSQEYYTGRALEIPSKACDFQKKSIMKSLEEYKKNRGKIKSKDIKTKDNRKG